MKRGHTTEFIVRTDDYFTAHLDNGGVRIGFVGGTCFDFPADHARHTEVVALTADTVESFHDEMMSAA